MGTGLSRRSLKGRRQVDIVSIGQMLYQCGMNIVIHSHARQRMQERGAAEEEIVAAIREGEPFEAKFGRTGFRKNFSYEKEWNGRFYRNKQLEVFAVIEDNECSVVTVIVRYF